VNLSGEAAKAREGAAVQNDRSSAAPKPHKIKMRAARQHKVPIAGIFA
jgi:hypothetical protein